MTTSVLWYTGITSSIAGKFLKLEPKPQFFLPKVVQAKTAIFQGLGYAFQMVYSLASVGETMVPVSVSFVGEITYQMGHQLLLNHSFTPYPQACQNNAEIFFKICGPCNREICGKNMRK